MLAAEAIDGKRAEIRGFARGAHRASAFSPAPARRASAASESAARIHFTVARPGHASRGYDGFPLHPIGIPNMWQGHALVRALGLVAVACTLAGAASAQSTPRDLVSSAQGAAAPRIDRDTPI